MCIFVDEDTFTELFNKESTCEKLRDVFRWCLEGESRTPMELATRKEDVQDKDYMRTLFFKALFFEENAWHKRTQIDCRRLRVIQKDFRGQYLAIPPEDNLPSDSYGSMYDIIGAESKRLAQAMYRIYECTRVDYFGTATKAQIARWAVLSHRDTEIGIDKLLDIVFEGRDMEHTAIEFLNEEEEAHVVFPTMKARSIYKTVMQNFGDREPGEFNLLSLARSISDKSEILKVNVETDVGECHDLSKDALSFAKVFYNIAKEQDMLSGVEFFDSTPAEWLMYYIVLAGR